MSVSCIPRDLADASKCFCLPPGQLDSVITYLLCQWANAGPPVPPIPAGIVGWWKFAEGAGTTAADSSGNGNTGTLGGDTPPTWDPTNGGLQFYRDVCYVDMGSPAVLKLSTNGTVCAWVRLTDNLLQAAHVIVNYFSFLSDLNGYCLFLDGAGKTEWETGSNSSQQIPVQSDMTVLSLSTWYHFGFTWDGANTITYLNGSSISSSVQLVPPSGYVNSFRVGGPEAGAQYTFVGNIDDVRVYKRALSGAEMAALFAGGRQ